MLRFIHVLAIAGILTVSAFSSKVFADTISVIPSSSTVSAGDNFVVDVNISGVADLYDFGFDLYFNPAVIQATKVVEGAFLPTGGPTFFIPGIVDNIGGSVTFNADTLESAGPGVTGSGTLVEFDFTAIASGISSLNLDPATLILQDSTGALIDSTTTNGSVTVEGTTPVPEPSSLVLLVTGVLVLAGLSAKKIVL
jgi:hypothetical protein